MYKLKITLFSALTLDKSTIEKTVDKSKYHELNVMKANNKEFQHRINGIDSLCRINHIEVLQIN